MGVNEIFEKKLPEVTDAFASESIAQAVDIAVPESLIQSIGREQYEQRLMEIQQQGQLSPEMVNKLTAPKLVNDYINKERDNFVMLARANIGVEEIRTQKPF